MTLRLTISIALVILVANSPAEARDGSAGSLPTLRGTTEASQPAKRIYAATTFCNATGRVKCGRGIFRLPEGTTRDLCEAAGMELRGQVIVGPSGRTGEMLQWTCFESATPVRGAIDSDPVGTRASGG